MDMQSLFIRSNILGSVELFSASKPIDYIRSEMANCFIHSTKHDWMLFIDDDVGFCAQDVVALLNAKAPLVVGAYPHRSQKSESVFVIDQKLDENKKPIWNETRTAIELNSGGTGFMLINRSVFINIQKKFPELEYEINYRQDLKNKKCFHYFDMIMENRQPLGEDVSFCRRYIATDNKIWCAVDTNLSHSGVNTFVAPKTLRAEIE